MGTQAAISIDEYLRTSFDNPDREYRDGEIIERAMPDYLHGKVQALLCIFFGALRKRLRLYPSVETRLRIAPNLVLIPDVCVFHPAEPGRTPEFPPYIAIEVLSLDDRLSEVRDKLEEYKKWGVRQVWLADPHSKRLYVCDAGLHEVESFKVSELDLELTPAEIFD